MAERRALVVSCGLSLLSMPMISNLTPAAFFLLNSSVRNWKVLSWLVPTAAIRPDSGSSHAILTVSPFWARAPVAVAARTAAVAIFRANFNLCLLGQAVKGWARLQVFGDPPVRECP